MLFSFFFSSLSFFLYAVKISVNLSKISFSLLPLSDGLQYFGFVIASAISSRAAMILPYDVFGILYFIGRNSIASNVCVPLVFFILTL